MMRFPDLFRNVLYISMSLLCIFSIYNNHTRIIGFFFAKFSVHSSRCLFILTVALLLFKRISNLMQGEAVQQREEDLSILCSGLCALILIVFSTFIS